MRRAAGLLALLLSLGAVARAGPAEDVAAASAGLHEAGAQLAAAREAEEGLKALGEAAQAYEAALERLRASALGAGAAERDLARDLALRREETTRLLAALQAVARTPPPVQGLHPQGPVGAARAAGMMAALTPALQAEAAELKSDLAAIETARQLSRRATEALAEGLETLNAARMTLRREMAAAATSDPAARIAQAMILRDIETLGALSEAIARQASAGDGEPEDALAWPVAGEVLSGFEARDAAGVRRPGITIRAPSLSLVSAPAAGIVRYAGPFLEYGYVVVLETGGGLLIVLAGLAEVEVAAGAPVERGDVLGMLGGRALGVEEYLMLPVRETGAGASETLYIEVRDGQGPIDPEPLFGGRNG